MASLDGKRCFSCETIYGNGCQECNRNTCVECEDGLYLNKNATSCILSC